jgi:hypothetical protein
MLTAWGNDVETGWRLGFTKGVITDARGVLKATASSTLPISDVQIRNTGPLPVPSVVAS